MYILGEIAFHSGHQVGLQGQGGRVIREYFKESKAVRWTQEELV